MRARRVLLAASFVLGVSGVRATALPPATQEPAADVVIRAADLSQGELHGGWTLAFDATASNAVKLTAWHTDGVPGSPVDVPLAAPADYVDVRFAAPAGAAYRVWLRLKTPGGSGDSVWLQFSDAEVDGGRAYAIETPTGLLVAMPPCQGCRTYGWGWQDTSWALRQPSLVRFTTSGVHTLRIQPRAAGVELDQIVLSPATYLKAAPGSPLDDLTVVPKR